MNFKNKVVLVTGAGAGIGKAIALLFAERGARLAIVDRNAQNLRAAADACAKDERPLEIVADLSTDEGCEKTVKETLERYGRLDVLVNNAGVGARTDLLHTDMAIFDKVFNTNVRGVYNLTRLLAPSLIETKGNIVNISSVMGTSVLVGGLPYSMTKAALDHFTRLIALELAPKGVRVNAVSPGVTVSEFVQTVTGMSDGQYSEYLANMALGIPMGRVCQPEHVAKMVVFLASEDCDLVTGTVVKVDGGVELSVESNHIKEQFKKK
ncbi:3-oxoacyl-[acyl-carrier-protein] reductase FabG-like [Leguminivora glycinivorella]|uniref:3-oxoacyl-[acyl-carrier-protein] reductase FabG-like n=1 Tax=Leguminivora glycinivorella TaxID=1035111 RepID=UPI00200BFE08|nr:3-oxoacyl-[acyl-carrier-protein] reductase FabG-like [Leguminivora glycinivorella]